MGVGQRGGIASKKQLRTGWMWKDKVVGSGVLKEKAKSMGAVKRQPGRKEQWQWQVRKRSRSGS